MAVDAARRVADGSADRALLVCGTYGMFEEMLSGARWRRLEKAGARPQRPLWASTGVKDPACEDTRYVTGLVAPQTVNTMPRATLDAVLDHGEVHGDSVTGHSAASREVLRALAAEGVDLDAVAGDLETDGVARFQNDWQKLTAAVRATLAAASTPAGGVPVDA